MSQNVGRDSKLHWCCDCCAVLVQDRKLNGAITTVMRGLKNVFETSEKEEEAAKGLLEDIQGRRQQPEEKCGKTLKNTLPRETQKKDGHVPKARRYGNW